MNVTADPTTPGGLGTFGFDDEGVPAAREPVVVEGVLRGLPHLPRDGRAPRRRRRRLDARRRLGPHAARADDEPPPRAGRGSLEELIADVDDGIYLETNKSWSIDDKRLNFQFGTQIAWEIKTAGSAACCATRPTRASRRSSGARSTRVAGPEEWLHVRADELRQGPAGPERARLARRVAGAVPRRPGRGASRDATRSRARRAARRAARAGDDAEAVVQTERSGLRALRRLGGAPADADRQRTVQLRVVRDGARRHREHQPHRRRRDRRARRDEPARRPRARPRPGASPASPPPAHVPRGRRLRRGDGRARRRGAGAARPAAIARVRAARRSTATSRAASCELAVASTTGLRAAQRLTDATVLALAAADGALGLRRATRPGAPRDSTRRRPPGGGREGRADARRAASSSRGAYRAVLEPYAFARAPRSTSPATRFSGLAPARGAQLLRGPARRARLRREGHDRRRRARPARPAEGVRLRGDAQAARRRSSRTACSRRRVGPRDGGARGHGSRPATRCRSPTRHGADAARARGGARRGGVDCDELAELVGDGIYVTRLHYLGVVDPREGSSPA